ncbi:hypothetical protein AnigIFM56816_010477 [Aspergillus niger]|nr:hypothetical protein AnigIFM56816_010477 [Aspergillus niger]
MSSEVADQYDGPPVVSPNVLNLKSRDGINRAGFPYSSSLEDADGPKLDGGISSAIYKSWEDESYGLHLRQSAVDGNDVVDVIAVHSLNGHPIKSFQDDNTGFNWLFQLQVDFRNVQVWSFKYRADVRVDNISLADVATQLRINIETKLQQGFMNSNPRIVFVGHGFGGTVIKKVESANRDFQNILEHFPRIVCLADNIGLGTTGSPPYADLALIPWRDGVRLDKTLLDTAKVSGRDDEVFRHILEKLSQWLQSPRPSAPRFLPVRSDEGGVRILTLDGGGVRGLSSLLILKAIMERIQIIKNLPRLPRVSEYFDLVAGTSTGGLIAIMLVRLEMDVNHAIDSYRYLSGQIFKRTGWYFPGKVTIKRSLVHPVFKAEPLEQEVKKLVRNHLSPQERRLVYPNVSEATLLAPTDSGCRM